MTLFLICGLLSVLMSRPAPASTIPVGGGGFGWVGLSGFTLNGNGTPYFDHDSSDGAPPGGIWPILNSQGIPNSRLQFWGTSSGGADPDILFHLGAGPESLSLTLKFEFAANAPVNEFGWFAGDLGGDGYQAADLHPIFGGPATSGASAVVALPAEPYGLYLKNTATGEVYLSLAGSSPTDPGLQHFAIFRDTADPGTLWIGIEDLRIEAGDQDYNDLVVTATAQTPEPTTLLLVGTGMVTAGIAWRRRRGSSSA